MATIAKKIFNENDGDNEDLVRTLLLEYEKKPPRRMTVLRVEGERYWVKRYGVESVFFGHRMHSIVAKAFKEPIFLPTPILPSQEVMKNEIDKLRNFQKAGIKTPDIVHIGSDFIIMTDGGSRLETVVKTLSDPEVIDNIYLEWVRRLKQVHQAGLCHGRPHPRDITLNEKRDVWTFLDFEQTPELVMPIEAAQARDFFICMLNLMLRFKHPETSQQAYDLYIEDMPEEILRQLQLVVTKFSWITKFDGLFKRVSPGKDVIRFAKTVELLGKQF